MKIEFAKWGNSLAVRIPAALAQEVGAREGRPAEITVENGALVLKPITRRKKRRRYTLEELLKGMTKENVHPQTEWGPPRGKEVW
ncbi:MAG TPA: AbrB/MazE/SpoVT family DNA-binding domain-containing protein [Xanthobacteraceae bacterium]|nr:AbrB/MazE/SpoVT family DNA-binding domain-containing protein [Xanthobacteraceae bacterium]